MKSSSKKKSVGKTHEGRNDSILSINFVRKITKNCAIYSKCCRSFFLFSNMKKSWHRRKTKKHHHYMCNSEKNVFCMIEFELSIFLTMRTTNTESKKGEKAKQKCESIHFGCFFLLVEISQTIQ